jgi:hypothetical protein
MAHAIRSYSLFTLVHHLLSRAVRCLGYPPLPATRLMNPGCGGMYVARDLGCRPVVPTTKGLTSRDDLPMVYPDRTRCLTLRCIPRAFRNAHAGARRIRCRDMVSASGVVSRNPVYSCTEYCQVFAGEGTVSFVQEMQGWPEGRAMMLRSAQDRRRLATEPCSMNRPPASWIKPDSSGAALELGGFISSAASAPSPPR